MLGGGLGDPRPRCWPPATAPARAVARTGRCPARPGCAPAVEQHPPARAPPRRARPAPHPAARRPRRPRLAGPSPGHPCRRRARIRHRPPSSSTGSVTSSVPSAARPVAVARWRSAAATPGGQRQLEAIVVAWANRPMALRRVEPGGDLVGGPPRGPGGPHPRSGRHGRPARRRGPCRTRPGTSDPTPPDHAPGLDVAHLRLRQSPGLAVVEDQRRCRCVPPR